MSRTESDLSYGNRVSQYGFTDKFGTSKHQKQPRRQQDHQAQ